MRTESLIIDLRHLLPWHRRYVSNTSTALLWGVWILLWRPFLLLWALVEIKAGHGAASLIDAMSLSLEQGITALIACAVALWLWSRFVPAQRARKRRIVLNSQDYARYFELPEQRVLQAREQKICVVHHDAAGKIIAVTAQPHAEQPSPVATPATASQRLMLSRQTEVL